MTDRTGRCLCGKVQFKLSAEPQMARVCWCRDCQHLASNGTVNALVPVDALSVSGEVAEFRKLAASGNELTRQFCPNCGSQLFAYSSARSQLRVVRIGNLDNPSSVAPIMNIWASSAPDWACMDASLQRVEQQPLPPTSSKP
ncbi:GFA family protein [Comamonas resistens]|uniref:GFA family protein n=1 Tax=Comamonas resistens TaxID=3046670 RepID=A0ABY8SWA7_9BURK|nr:GFA family protein [Comamonas resistens]MDL5038074.1 GFA family protein [Comamonas resistens]WHS66901.1 GFA family protein [Comamonas resistens]